ncbi:hypothetical protein BDP27DRAFT_1328579 [Rhodocollybia butyracea]|uniref:F-box domain-containing protein n=1 Tax=Rhodocollybia butyracea TaxID=206335 RepID=A0A9P5U635_9AGAR|nr:hypothetical protein BDP27DRAFT_1328579 [Rhodocollybia butyracea]
MTHNAVQTVPNEILEAIFDDCCDTNLFSSVNATITSSLREIPALTLSSVCTRWRRVGLALSRIWSRISLEHSGDSFMEDQLLEYRLSATLTTFISRSRQQPLIISICLDDSLAPDIWGSYEPFCILSREHQRWSNFAFQSENWMVHHLFISPDSLLRVDAFPMLVDLNLPLDDTLTFFIGRAPSLRRLKLTSALPCYDRWEIPSLSPLAQLEHLRLDTIWSLVVKGRLIELSALRSLDVNDYVDDWDLDWLYDDYDDFKSVPPTVYPSVEVLNVRHHEDGSSDSIFPFLTLPSLKTLCIDCGQGFVERHHLWRSFDALMAFVKRSSFPLTTLCIKCVALPDSKLIYLLHRIPTLLNLAIMDPIVKDRKGLIPITGRFLQSLYVGTGSLFQPTTPLVPRLRCLTLSVGERLFVPTEVLGLVKSRSAHGSKSGVDCLQSLTIIFRGQTKVPGAYDALNGIKKDDMKITVFCSNNAADFELYMPKYQ